MLLQWLYNNILKNNQDTFIAIVRYRIMKKIERIFVNVATSLMRTKIHGAELSVPWTHQLPFILKKYPGYSANLTRIAKTVQEVYSEMTMVDIGANIGDTVIMLRAAVHFPILCIEGERYFFQIMESNLTGVKDVWFHCGFVGSDDGDVKGSVRRHSGTGSLVLNHNETNVIPVQSLSSILSTYPRFTAPTMVKIDTDGFDCTILRGCSKLLAAAHPVLFFEYDPHFLSLHGDDGLSIFPFLARFGYQHILVFDNFGSFICSAECSDTKLLEELHHFVSGRNGEQYYDLCVLHQSETSLFQTIRSTELQLKNA